MAALHRIETLPGDGRYVLTFRGRDQTEQSAVVQLANGRVKVAAASLPEGWSAESENFRAVADALHALERARSASAAHASELRDVPGGWDVMLGNVTVQNGVARCTAHGAMEEENGVFRCGECAAQALYG